MRNLKKFIRHNRVLNILPRIFYASRYYNYRYGQILKWAFRSKEDTNYTFPLKASNVQELAQLIAIVTNKEYHEVMAYIQEVVTDKTLRNHVITNTKASHQRQIADERFDIHKRMGWYAFVRALKPGVVVETGIDKGLGAVTLCAALLRNKEEGFAGKYFGTDINPEAGYLLTKPYDAIGEILYGDSIKSLQNLNEQIDLFINDSDHSEEYEYREYQTILPRLTAKSVILGDNSHVTDKLLRFSLENNRRYLFFKEEPEGHWYPGGGIGVSFPKNGT